MGEGGSLVLFWGTAQSKLHFFSNVAKNYEALKPYLDILTLANNNFVIEQI